MLTYKQIDQKIRGAFLPFRCAVEFGNYTGKLRFKVFDHSRNRILEMSSLPAQKVQDEGYLKGLLTQLRHHVQDSGYTLKPMC